MPLSRSTSSFFDRLFWRPAIRFLVPLSRSAASYSDRLFWRPAIRFPVPLSRSASPFLTGYFDARLSGFSFLSPAPPRLILTGYFDARLSGFRCLSPAPQRLLLTGYFTARISGFRCPISRSASSFSDRLFWRPGLPFPVPQGLLFAPRFGILDRLFRRPPFSHPTFPSRLFGWPARSLCRLTVSLRFFTAPRFLPPRGFYRGFYRSAVFTAPLSPVLWGALLFHRPRACCPPVFPHFRAARSLGHLTVRLRFLPLRGFYRSAVFTAPRFLPLRDFYRSAVFTAPRFFAAPLSPVLWGALLFLSAPQSSPSSGRTLCYRLLRSVSGGTPFLIFFLYHLLNRSRSVTAHLTGFPFVHFIHIRGSSVVSSFEWRDTGTTCTTTSLMGPFGYRKLGNLTYHRLL